jgi:hypothetical protein
MFIFLSYLRHCIVSGSSLLVLANFRSQAMETVQSRKVSAADISLLDDAMISSLENKPQQYTIGFLVGFSGKSSNMTKSSDWLQGYCAGLQQRLRGFGSEESKNEMIELHYQTGPVALPTPPLTVYNVQIPVTTSGSALPENTPGTLTSWPNGGSTLNTIRSGYVPRFPGDGPIARSGPMGQFHMPPKPSGPILRPNTSQTLTGFAGNRAVSQQIHSNSSIVFSDFQVSRHGGHNTSGESPSRADNSSEGEARYGSSDTTLAFPQYTPSKSLKSMDLMTDCAFNLSEKLSAPGLMAGRQHSPFTNGVVAPASSPARSTRTPESPKRSPSKRLEHLTRHFRSNTNNSNEHISGGSPSSLEGLQASQTNERRRWRDGLGRRFSRRDNREDDSTNMRRNSTYVPAPSAVRGKI